MMDAGVSGCCEGVCIGAAVGSAFKSIGEGVEDVPASGEASIEVLGPFVSGSDGNPFGSSSSETSCPLIIVCPGAGTGVGVCALKPLMLLAMLVLLTCAAAARRSFQIWRRVAKLADWQIAGQKDYSGC